MPPNRKKHFQILRSHTPHDSLSLSFSAEIAPRGLHPPTTTMFLLRILLGLALLSAAALAQSFDEICTNELTAFFQCLLDNVGRCDTCEEDDPNGMVPGMTCASLKEAGCNIFAECCPECNYASNVYVTCLFDEALGVEDCACTGSISTTVGSAPAPSSSPAPILPPVPTVAPSPSTSGGTGACLEKLVFLVITAAVAVVGFAL